MLAKQQTPAVPGFTNRWSARYQDDISALECGLATATLSGESRAVREYEQQLASHFGSRHAVAVSSGTAAIHLALRSVGAGEGSEVLVPAIAPLPSLLPVLAAGATPVVVDVAPLSLSFDPADLDRKITERTRAALAVELWGYPQDFTPTLEVLQSRKIPLIEDACQAHGTSMPQGLAGRVGAIGCFSTHDYKLLATGEGGFILTDDDALAANIDRSARLGGLDGVHRGVNYKLSGLAAALGSSRLRHLAERLQVQRNNAQTLRDGLVDAELSELPAAQLGSPNGYSLVMLLAEGRHVTEALSDALAKRGIPTDKRQYAYDLVYRRPMFAHLSTPCPHAEAFIDRCIQLPCHPGLSVDNLHSMAAEVAAVTRQ